MRVVCAVVSASTREKHRSITYFRKDSEALTAFQIFKLFVSDATQGKPTPNAKADVFEMHIKQITPR
jgi:hypothetical protein